MTAKRSHPRIPILLRLEPEELARLDKSLPGSQFKHRTDFIRDAVRRRCNAIMAFHPEETKRRRVRLLRVMDGA